MKALFLVFSLGTGACVMPAGPPPRVVECVAPCGVPIQDTGRENYQKTAAEKDRELRAEARAEQASASASLLSYEKEAKSPLQMMGLAITADACGIRSETWTDHVTNGLNMYVGSLYTKFKIDRKEGAAAYVFFQDTINSSKFKIGCESLVNSPTMDKLDRIEYRATGGYH